ncbi:MAG: helix-turn-helix domain-containing protein [Gordonia sp. (in: high G+C Gram-positive bacteria)]|uniref:GlxA family transcriptional regulator n=1 Tax=Gordonia sp. (in: high G+C Gram-positive bacteria) TaxID=84139 RepID=UPI0039E29521
MTSVVVSGPVHVDVLVLRNASAGAVGATVDVLSAADRIIGEHRFVLRFVGVGATTVLRGGLSVTTCGLDGTTAAGVVIVPGLGAATPDEVTDLLGRDDVNAAAAWLRRAAAAGSEIAASCTAAFVLGAAGLLDGRRCATTWWLGDTLASLVPSARVDVGEMVVHDRGVWTAGSAFAHTDLLLALVRRHAGADVTDEVARRLIVDERPSQAAYLVPTHVAAHDDLVADLERRIRAGLDRPMSLTSLADDCHTSARTLNRRTRAAVGMSPMQLVQRIRLERALHLLRTTDQSVESIGSTVGLNDPSTLYRLVKRHTGHAPGVFRPTPKASAGD